MIQEQEEAGFWLSPQQEQIWNSGYGHAVAVVGLSAPAEAGRLRLAVRELVRLHEPLRTVYRRMAGMKLPFQNYCVGATSTVGCAALRNIFVQTPGTLSAGATYGPVSRLSVSKDINVGSGAGGTATISLVTNQFSNGGGPSGSGAAVPEPATVTVFGFGLGAVAFGVIKKRRSTLN